MLKFLFDYLFPKNEKVLRLEKMTWPELEEIAPKALRPESREINAIFSYKDPLVHELLWEIKYHANKKLADLISPIVLDYALSIIHDEAFFTEEDQAIITFIPASKSRHEKRGFDQGQIILESLEKADTTKRFKYASELLSYNKEVIQQSLTKSKLERLINMGDAFKCPQPQLIQNKTIIIMDDVCTTGATLLDAKRAIEEAGARKVYLMAISH